jgi:TusA-related sulfurtransferase
LSGNVYCSHCGKKLNRNYYNYGKDNQRVVLTCKNRYKDASKCDNKPIENAPLEMAVKEAIGKLNTSNSELLKSVSETVISCLDTTTAENELKALQHQYDLVELEIREIMDMNLSSLNDNADFYKDIYNQKKSNLISLQSKINNQNNELVGLHLHEERMNQINTFLKGYTPLNKTILEGVFKAVIQLNQNEVIFVISDNPLNKPQIKNSLETFNKMKPVLVGTVSGSKPKLQIKYKVIRLETENECS